MFNAFTRPNHIHVYILSGNVRTSTQQRSLTYLRYTKFQSINQSINVKFIKRTIQRKKYDQGAYLLNSSNNEFKDSKSNVILSKGNNKSCSGKQQVSDDVYPLPSITIGKSGTSHGADALPKHQQRL